MLSCFESPMAKGELKIPSSFRAKLTSVIPDVGLHYSLEMLTIAERTLA
jgi:hypothetical protein